MALPPLEVVIGANTDKLNRGLRSARGAIAAFGAAAATGVAAATAALSAMTAQGLEAVDAQAKLAQSLGTTTKSIQVLERAGGLAGVAMAGVEQATKDLTRRLSQAAGGAGPAADALKHLRLNAQDLAKLPLDQRISTINSAIRRFIPAAQQAAIAGQLFGEEGSIAISRLSPEVIQQATRDIDAFGIAVSDIDAAAIETTNDAISRMGLSLTGLRNQLAVQVAPALQRFADRFNELAAGPGQEIIQRLAADFGDLADNILTPETLDAIAAALSGVMRAASMGIDGLKLLVDNFELAAGGATALAIALAGLSGPFGMIAIGAGAVVALATGFGKIEGPAGDAKEAIDAARQVQDQLNTALGTFDQTGAPKAAAAARDLAVAYIDQSRAAYDAAQAEVEKTRAILASRRAEYESTVNPGGGNIGDLEGGSMLGGQMDAAQREYNEALATLSEIEAGLSAARSAIKATLTGPVQGPNQPGQGGGGGQGDEGGAQGDGPPAILPELGSLGQVQDQLALRLEAIMAGLATEREALNAWREEGLADLESARNRELITEQEYLEAKRRLQEEYARRSTQIAQQEAQQRQAVTAGMLNNLISLQNSGNKEMFKIGKAAAIAQALISGREAIINSYRAGTRVGGPALGAAFAATAAAATAAQIASLRSTNFGGGGGGAVSTGGSAPVTVQQPAAGPVNPGQQQEQAGLRQAVNITLVGDTFSADGVERIFNQLQEGADRGLRIPDFVVSRA